jgi:hypothetical protein
MADLIDCSEGVNQRQFLGICMRNWREIASEAARVSRTAIWEILRSKIPKCDRCGAEWLPESPEARETPDLVRRCAVCK